MLRRSVPVSRLHLGNGDIGLRISYDIMAELCSYSYRNQLGVAAPNLLLLHYKWYKQCITGGAPGVRDAQHANLYTRYEIPRGLVPLVCMIHACDMHMR